MPDAPTELWVFVWIRFENHYKYQSGYYINSVMESANFVVVLKISIGCTYFFSHNFLSHHDEVYPSVSMWQMMSFPHVWKKNAARRLWLSDSVLNHGEGPTCSALNHTKIKSHSLSPKEEQAGAVHPGRHACQHWKNGHLSTAARHVLHFPWQVLVEGSGRHRCYAELTFPHKTPTVMYENVFFSKSAHADT